MTESAERQAALPGNQRSAGVARDVVLDVIAEAGLGHLASEAAVLTTELAAHNLLYTGSEVHLHAEADDTGITVTLSDPLRRTTESFEPNLNGSRALYLLDTLASSWGTAHDARGQSVWFRLNATGGDPATVHPGPAKTAQRPAGNHGFEQLAHWLTYLPEHVARHLSNDQALVEILRRVCGVTGATAAVLWLDEGGNTGRQPVAWHGLTASPTRADLRQGSAPTTAGPTSPAAAALGLLDSVDAGHTVWVPLPLGAPLRGGLDIGFSSADRLSEHSTTLMILAAERLALMIEGSRAREVEVRRRGFLVFLAEASELLANSLDVELTMMLVTQLCVTRLGEWCAVHIPGPHGRPELTAASHVDEREIEALRERFTGDPSDPIEQRLRRVIAGEGVMNLPDDLSGIVVPLTARRQVVGTMSIGSPKGHRHTPDETGIAEDLGRRAGLALLNARLYQERDSVAVALQRGLLPTSLPTATGIQFGASYVPSGDGNQVGGDFYDVVSMTGDRWLVAIGDVCGKGPEAASVTGVVRDVIRVLVREGRPLPYVLTALNATLLEQRTRSGFCTVAAAVVQRCDDIVRVQLCLAGHMLPVVLRADGSAALIGQTGMAVGVFQTIQVGAMELDLAPGESLVFYTDGVTERRDGNVFFGESTLLETLRGHAKLDAPQLSNLVQRAATDFGAESPRDDIAILVVRNMPESS